MALITGGYALLGASITLLGWITDIPRLTDWKNDGISMFPNTAVAAMASGLAIMLIQLPRAGRRFVSALGGLVAALGGLTLVEHLSGVNLGIDTLLFEERWGQFAAAAPMRMGPPASVSFLLIGTAVLLLRGTARQRGIAAGLGVAAIAIAMLSLIGHLYGAQPMYTVPHLTGIAMQTASMLLALGVGLVASAPDREPMRAILEPSSAGVLARRTLPLLIVVAVALGWLRVVAENYGLVDLASGTAARTLVEIALLTGLLWQTVRTLRTHERHLRESEVALRRQAGQLATFLDTAAIALHRVGPDGVILWANDAELALLGYAREEYIGRHIAEFHVDREVIDDILARLHGGEKIVQRRAWLRCRDGTVKTVLIDSSVLWEDGRFVHSQCFTRDVTEQERAEAEREEANRRKDEFLAILAHELRNPLAPVRNAAHYLRLQSPSEPELRRAIDMIDRQVTQMTRLIDDLLDVSRISRGVLELRCGRVDLLEVVQAAVEVCRDEVDSKRHALLTHAPPQPVIVHADRERLVQVLCNLIGNAAKYTPAGGVIEIRIAPRAGAVEVAVIDTGVGVAQEKLREIFEPFARGDDPLQRQDGLGIGLTLARQLVELHGGTIEARSQGVGHGSEFAVTLPAAAHVAAAAPRPAEPRSACLTRRILVADDNHDAVESLALLLKLAGHHVHTVFDGAAAISAAEAFRPDVALLDIGMPKANGYEVARHVRGQPWGKGIYLVALTGWGQQSDKRRAQEAGFDAHLVKPVPPEALERVIAAARPAPL